MLESPEKLQHLVGTCFRSAKASGALAFSQTDLAVLRTSSGLPFQLRFCPSLAQKPKPRPSEAATKAPFDPFESPPPSLHICDLASHRLVLNKFPIIAEHFILATKLNKKQTHLLEQDDLEATYACLTAWQQGPNSHGGRLFAFFNSGKHSGASQPHRHLQFLPVERMCEDEACIGWELLADLILSGRVQPDALPFTYFSCSFSEEPSGPELLKVYNKLHQQAVDATSHFIATNPNQMELHSTEDGDSPISYNLAMTKEGMVILPRRAEGTSISCGGSESIGLVALNGTALGGTMLVKHQEEWDVLRNKPGVLDDILMAIGIPCQSQSYRLHV